MLSVAFVLGNSYYYCSRQIKENARVQPVYKKMAPKLYRSIKRAPTSVKWAKDGKTFTYVQKTEL